jgi:hypothetical protein
MGLLADLKEDVHEIRRLLEEDDGDEELPEVDG